MENTALSSSRKNMFLRGNGRILTYFEPSEGRASQYQVNFKSSPHKAAAPFVDNGNFQSNAMTITPDPRVVYLHKERATQFNHDLKSFRDKESTVKKFFNKRST